MKFLLFIVKKIEFEEKVFDQYIGSELYFSINGVKSKFVKISKDEEIYWPDEMKM